MTVSFIIILYFVGVLFAFPLTIYYDFQDLKDNGNEYFTVGHLIESFTFSFASWIIALPLLYNFIIFLSNIKLFRIKKRNLRHMMK